MPLSNRVRSIEESKTVGLATLIHDLKAQGRDIISLNVGEPDFHTHDQVKQATISAINDEQTKYSLVPGIVKLREAICTKLKKDNNIDVNIENISISNGSKQTLFNIFQTIINEGDEVIIFSPYWVTFPESIKLAGGVPIIVETINNQIDTTSIKQKISSKTKAIVVNTPNNPTGAIYPEKTLREIAKIAVENDLIVISDEAYEKLVYSDEGHFSIASIDSKTFDKTITVQSFSKSSCMTGFRIGYMAASKKIIKAVNKLQSHLTGNNCTFAQYGALAALDLEQKYYDDMKEIFKKRRDLAYSLFSKNFPCVKPEGAFYLFMDAKKYLGNKYETCDDFAKYILMEASVALVPGVAFGKSGYLRLSFAQSEEVIKEAHKRLEKIL